MATPVLPSPPRLDPAPADPVDRALGGLTEHLSPLHLSRLTALRDLIGPDHRIPYAAAYEALFPGCLADPAAKTRADKSFDKLRRDLREAAGDLLELKVDQRRKAPPAERRLWFVTLDDTDSQTEAAVRAFNQGAIQALPEITGEQNVIVGRPFWLLVYALEDEEPARTLAAALAAGLKAGDCPWEMRDWHRPVPGEVLEDTRRGWLADARFVLVLLSPALLAAIKTGALALATDSPLWALALREFNPDHLADTPVAGRWLPIDDGRPWYGRNLGRDAWVHEASTALLDCIAGRPPRCLSEQRRPKDPDAAFARARDLFARPPTFDDLCFIEPKLTLPDAPAGRNALDLLRDWLRDPEASLLCAIFGELGMGKTTLCQRLTLDLHQRRDQDEAWPLPVYLDLRAVNNMTWDWTLGPPTLDAMLEQIIQDAWNLGVDAPRPSAADLARLAQRHGALVIFDGLDEVMNRLTPDHCRQFIQRLWSILPPDLWKPPAGLPAPARKTWRRPPGVGRLLMTCRSHFFATLNDQLGALTGQGREPVRRADYLWATLLPFTELQVAQYFRQVFADDPGRADQALAMLGEIHDLKDLSARPYNLSLIQGQLAHLEAVQRAGRRVDVADLYEGLVGDWTQRDNPKHRLLRNHKLLLMERLALHLWAGANTDLPPPALEDWLIDQLRAEPRWTDIEYRAYLNTPGAVEILKEDLRNASFLVRDGNDRFRFAHTSIQEFFLARGMLRALREDRPAVWAIPTPSPETLDFLGQLLAREADAGLLARMTAWGRLGGARRGGDGVTGGAGAEDGFRFALPILRGPAGGAGAEDGFRCALPILRYALRAAEQGWPVPGLAGLQLAGADLAEQVIAGPAAGPLLDLSGADLGGCRLAMTRFERVRLTNARFTAARLTQAEFLHCEASGSDWSGAHCDGAVWRKTRLTGARWDEAIRTGCRFLLSADAPDVPGHPSHAAPTGSATPHGTGADRPPLRLLTGHSDAIYACVFSPDGCRLLSASGDGTLRLWDAASGESLAILRGHKDLASDCAFSSDGLRLLSASGDGTLRLWDVASGETLAILRGHNHWVTVGAFSPDDRRLLSASWDRTLRIWDAASGESLAILRGHSGEVTACAFSPDGHRLLSASGDGTLRLWDAASGETISILRGHEYPVAACAFSPDGHRLLSASDDRTLRLWDAASGETLTILRGHQGSVRACAFSPDGHRLLSASHDRTLRLWDAATGETLAILSGHEDEVNACAFAPDGHRLLSASDDHTLRLWDAASGESLAILRGRWGWVTSCAFSTDGHRLLSASGDGTLRLWDAASGASLAILRGHKSSVLACAFCPDGHRLLSASTDGTLRLWDAATGETLTILRDHKGMVWACAFSPDGLRLLSASEDRTLRLWDAATGESLGILRGHESEVTASAFSHDGHRLLSASGDGTLRLWDAASGESLAILRGHEDRVLACAFSPDGRRLLSASHDRTLRLWNAASRETLAILRGHEGPATACTYSPDGHRLLSASGDGTLRLWDAASGESLALLRGHEGPVFDCAFSPDGLRLLSASLDGTLRLWDAATGELLRIHAAWRTVGIRGRHDPGHAVWDPRTNRVLDASGDAWRWLRWVATGPDGWPDPLPLETYGPIPGL